MISSLDLPNGTLEVRTARRNDRRWFSEYRFTPSDGHGTNPLQAVSVDTRTMCLRVDAYNRNIAMAAAPMIAVAVQPRTIMGRLAV